MKIISLILVLYFLQGCLLNHSELNDNKMKNVISKFECLSIFNKREESLSNQIDKIDSVNDFEYLKKIWEYKNKKVIIEDSKKTLNDYNEKLNNLIITKVKDIEKENNKTIKSKYFSYVIVNNFCKKNIVIKVLLQIIEEYYSDHKKSPHIILYKSLDNKNQREFLLLINSARNEMNMESSILSFYKSIEKNDIKEVKYLYDLLFPAKNDFNTILSRYVILKSLKLEKKYIYKYLINKFHNKKDSIHKCCIKNAINTENLKLFMFLFEKINIKG